MRTIIVAGKIHRVSLVPEIPVYHRSKKLLVGKKPVGNKLCFGTAARHAPWTGTLGHPEHPTMTTSDPDKPENPDDEYPDTAEEDKPDPRRTMQDADGMTGNAP